MATLKTFWQTAKKCFWKCFPCCMDGRVVQILEYAICSCLASVVF